MDIIDQLTIPFEDTTRSYESSIREVIKQANNNTEEFYELLSREDVNNDVRYAAFYTLCTIHRRAKEYSRYKELIDKYEHFSIYKSYAYLKSMQLVETNPNKQIYEKAMVLSKSAISIAGDNSGYLHNYAIIVAKAFDENCFSDREDLLHEAMECVNKAIAYEEKYAKFYATKGRLSNHLGQYEEARQNIDRAIDLENADETYYVMRIGEYQMYLLNVYFKEKTDSMNHELKGFKDEMKIVNDEISEAKTKNLEFLGFFTALISFTIGSIQILSNQSFYEAMKLIIVLSGSLLIVLGGFGIVLTGSKNIKRSITVWILGILMIVIAATIV